MEDILVIFDCDGVLVDSETIACQVESEELSGLGYPIDKDGLIKKFLGLSKEEIHRIILTETGISLPANYPQILHGKVMRRLQMDVAAVPGVLSALKLIPNKCIASGAPADRIDLCLSMTGISNFFENNHVFSTDMVARSKPAPDIHRLILRRMGFPPERCIVIEDSVVGVKAARNAGLRSLGFTGCDHAQKSDYAEKLIAAGAVATFDTMTLLLPMIEHALEESYSARKSAIQYSS